MQLYLHCISLSPKCCGCCFVVQSLSCVQLFATPRTTAHQAFLSFTFSWSLLRLMSFKLVMPSNHCISPSVAPFPPAFKLSQYQGLFLWTSYSHRWPSFGASASASVLPTGIQCWFPLGWTDWISLQSKGLSRVFLASQYESINSSALSLLYGPTLTKYMTPGKTIALTTWTFVSKVMSLHYLVTFKDWIRPFLFLPEVNKCRA